MEWQGDKYGFLHILDCWSRLGVKKLIADSTSWRRKYQVTVAVLDSGIKRNHQAFKHLPDEGIQGKNFISPGTDDDNIDDVDGHGTMCAAIIAGGCYNAVEYKNGEVKEGKFWNGVAPFVNLYICKTDMSDSSTDSDVGAIKHLIEEKKKNRLKVDIISMSCGFEEYNAQLEKCIQEASLNNIIVVCAASNEGRRSSNSILYPARLGHVICVGSHNYLGRESSFTGVGREIDILGPGEIKSAIPVPTTPDGQVVTTAIAGATGTSFAAPYVAGIVAIILANAQRIGGPGLRDTISNNVVMKQILREMASEPGDHTQFRGHGSLDPLRILGFSKDYFHQILESITYLAPLPEPDENYDLRKVAIWFVPQYLRYVHETAAVKFKHVTRPVKLGEDVKFSSRMDTINLRLPEFAEVDNLVRMLHDGYDDILQQYKFVQQCMENISIDLKDFCDKIKQEVTEISCLSLPSPLHAAYGDKKGSDALQEFLTQLGGGRVISVEDLWLEGGDAGEDKLTFSDIKKILQTLRNLKSADTGQLTVHCEEVDVLDLMKFNPTQEEIPNIANVKVIIHHSSGVCNWRRAKQIPAGMEHTVKLSDSTYITIEACSPECLLDWQVVSADGSMINLKFPIPPAADERKTLLSEAVVKVNTEVTELGKAVSCLILPCVSDAIWEDKEGVEALKAVLDETGQVNNLQHLWCGGAKDMEHLKEILDYLQQKIEAAQKLEAAQIPLTVHFYQMGEVKGDLSDIPNVNVKVIIHHPPSSTIHRSAAVCAWRQAQGLQVGKEHDNGGIVTIEACRPGCNSTSEQVVRAEDMACDISLEKQASRDGAAALHATFQKHQGNLKGDVHVTVAVLGSGVYTDHEAVAQMIIKDKACFVPQESWDLSVDTCGTGTALASIATSFAPAQTQLLTAKVIDVYGRSNPAWVAKAVDWAANHSSHPADVILIPVGFEKFDHGLYEAVTTAQNNGKIVIAAAAHSTEAPEISYPARHGDVICVGSHSRTGTASSFRVRGREMDFLVMGEENPVKAASAKRSNLYTSVSGTSVAAAMATAVVGFTLMYAESVGEEDLRDMLKSNTMMRELLREACSSRGFHTPDRGYGTLDPDRLFKWGSQHFSDLVKKIAGT